MLSTACADADSPAAQDGKKMEGSSPRGHVRFGGSQASEATSTASTAASTARHLHLTELWLAGNLETSQGQVPGFTWLAAITGQVKPVVHPNVLSNLCRGYVQRQAGTPQTSLRT